MTNSTWPRTWVRAVNTAFAVALAAFVLANYWPIVKLFDLSRADLQLQGDWIGGHAKRITAVTPGGVADRAALKVGDVLEFDPSKDADWVLASYRSMPEGFTGSLPVRHADGTRAVATFAPERVPYLPTLNDGLALLARLCGLTVSLLVGVVLVWARPSLMTWSIFLACSSTAPARVWSTGFLAFTAVEPNLAPIAVIMGALMYLAVFNLPFSLSFPRDVLPAWPLWKRTVGLAVFLGLAVCASPGLYVQPFAQDAFLPLSFRIWTAIAALITFAAVMVLMRTYHQAGGAEKARLKWAVLGLSSGLAGNLLAVIFFVLPFNVSNPLSGSGLTPAHWTLGLITGVVFPLALGYAVLRQRVVDVQFAISQTLVYGVVSTLVLVLLAVLHWLLGRMIEQSELAIGVEGLAAVGVGLVLHRASHGITLLVDRVLFRKHHKAEERLRRVTAALPYATDERVIAEALVVEPARNLELASAALFYRDSPEGPLRRVLAKGWGEEHAASLEADSLLVRYLQAEHAPLKLEDAQLLPAGVPDGAALPVLAIPIVNQHVLAAVVLYGSHANHTLLDPDEIDLLHALAKAAATSHSQVRIAMLQREVAGLSRETEAQQKMLERFEAKLGALVQEGAAAATHSPS
jgi:hypothetical protein